MGKLLQKKKEDDDDDDDEQVLKKKFYHPYDPYDIQLQLMQCIYDTLEDSSKKIAILESPTGTGKTLSLICSTVTWLRQNKIKYLSAGKSVENSDDVSDSDDEPEWVKSAYNNSILSTKVKALQDYEKLLDDLSKKPTSTAKEVSNLSANHPRKLKRQKLSTSEDTTLQEEDFIVKEYSSDTEENVKSYNATSVLNAEVKDLLAKLESKQDKTPETRGLDLPYYNPIKIFFSSRTHSQLTQFASQLKMLNFPSSFIKQGVTQEHLKYTPLASRKQFCINPKVRDKWKTVEAINDACLELLKTKEGCPFYSSSSTEFSKLMTKFRDSSFTAIHDIEDLVSLGESLHICPYYSTREDISSSEIVTLPYQYILSQSTRQTMGLDLKGSIVVIDEAHNLIDTINSIYSATISLQELETCQKGLKIYLFKFSKRLNPGNRVNIQKLIKLFEVLIQFIHKHPKKKDSKIDMSSFFNNTNADSLNIHKLNKYIKVSKLAYKVDTYLKSLQRDTSSSSSSSSSQPLLFKVANFMGCLTNPASEGQFFFEKDSTIKYMLLEPQKFFQSMLDEARCVILAGGTMEPISDFISSLFPEVNEAQIVKFSCNHIIPDSHLQTYITQEPAFEFTFDKRQNSQLINTHLFNFFNNLAQAVPPAGGIVAFFPSYQYLKFVIGMWKQHNLFEKLHNIRKIFYESKGGADPLQEYCETIANGEGAILFAIVGGKLSEGINFQDNLCRAVVMTGLPYPNVFSNELLLRKEHLESKVISSGGSKEDATKATREFYENMCMKAVNQSVGRAIRHASDYANIYLLDRRYATSNIRNKLSQWVRNRIQPESSVAEIMSSTANFFDAKA